MAAILPHGPAASREHTHLAKPVQRLQSDAGHGRAFPLSHADRMRDMPRVRECIEPVGIVSRHLLQQPLARSDSRCGIDVGIGPVGRDTDQTRLLVSRSDHRHTGSKTAQRIA